MDERELRAENTFHRQKWESGKPPQNFIFRLSTIHAHSFIHAADMLGKMIGVLKKKRDIPPVIEDIVKEFMDKFPTLKSIRNSIAHQEDRIQKIGPKGPYTSPPMDSRLAKAPAGGFYVSNFIMNDTYATTLGDGSVGELPITVDTLGQFQEIAQRVINAFQWTGRRRVYPR